MKFINRLFLTATVLLVIGTLSGCDANTDTDDTGANGDDDTVTEEGSPVGEVPERGPKPAGKTCVPGTKDGTFDAVRINNSAPLITWGMFSNPSDGGNINGPSVIRIPDFATKPAPEAVYFMYFAHHKGSYIRLAWASSLEGPWKLYNDGKGVLALGNDGELQVGPDWKARDHIASPDVFVDNTNKRIVMYFHGKPAFREDGREFKNQGGQVTFVATSKTGLNFTTQAGALGDAYSRAFTVDGQMFGFTNTGRMYQVPILGAGPTDNDAWKKDPEKPDRKLPWRSIASPIGKMYAKHRDPRDPRHFAVLTACDDPDSLFVFWTSKGDKPEQIYLTRFSLSGLDGNQRLVPENWKPVGQKVILKPEHPWEGSEYPLEASQGSDAVGANQLRDPAVFVDNDGKVFLFYSGNGEGAIGGAELIFSTGPNVTTSIEDTDPNNIVLR